MKTFILALQFFTRIPIKISLKIEEGDFAKGIVYLPIIGLIIGLFNGLAYLGISRLIEGAFPVICALLANTLITGALHIDGIADTCDGIFSSRTKEKMLEIMKDSRVGTNGVVAIVFDYLLRFGVLSALSPSLIIYALVLSPVVGRTIMVILIYFSVYARKQEGLGGLFLGKVSLLRVFLCIVFCSSILFGVIGYAGLIALGFCILTGLAYRAVIYSKIGGMTGDTLGGSIETTEIFFIIAIAVLWRYGLL